MIKIYRYQHDTKEWHDLINDSSLKGQTRDKAIDDFIQKNGKEVSITDYFNDYNRNSWSNKNYSYKCFGDPENCIEKLAHAEMDYDNDLSYISAKNNNPEDLCESRTDWDEMKEYADGLYYFIESIKSEIANGTIIVKSKTSFQ